MVQGYYTLQEAAQFLSMPVDELKQMAQKNQIRSFQDRGNLRFRIQDIQELARTRSGSSDPDLVLGDASLPPPSKAGPTSSSGRRSQLTPKTPNKLKQVPEVFDFDMDQDDQVDLSADFLAPRSGAKSGPKSGPKSKTGSGSKKKSPTPPSPPKGSDSDVRLVADGSDVSFSLPKDSDIKLADSAVKIGGDAKKPKSGQPASSGGRHSSQVALGSGVQPSKSGSSKKQPSPKPASGPQPVDSGVRLVPMDSDSDVKILGASDEVPLGEHLPQPHADSNVRLERVHLPPADSGEGNMMQTEEINLDEEIRKLEERAKKAPPSKMKAKSELKFPTTSPFELSDSEMKMPPELLGESGPKTPVRQSELDADSSDFDLLAAGSDSHAPDDESDFSLSLSSDDSHEHVLHEGPEKEFTGESSGISLSNPVDAGISLEEGGGASEESLDFDLSLEVEDTPKPSVSDPSDDDSSDFQLQLGNTPQPSESQPADDSSSEFELGLESEIPSSPENEESDIDFSLSVDADQGSSVRPTEDSEFELNVSDDESIEGGKLDSDSEFELTLDDSGNISSMESEDDSAPQVKSKAKGKTKMKAAAEAEQDIFETDFEVPALDDSSSDSAASDSELESSDFDLALDDSELAPEEESGSQVVALDEEDAETLVDSDADAAVVDDLEVEEESSDFGDLDEDVQVEDEADEQADTESVGEPSGKREVIIKEILVPPAPWGVLPVVFLLPCVVAMFLVGILGYELMQTGTGLRPPGTLTVAVAEFIGQPIGKR